MSFTFPNDLNRLHISNQLLAINQSSEKSTSLESSIEGSYWSCGSLQAFQGSRFDIFSGMVKECLNDVSKERFNIVDVNVSSVEKNVNIMNIQILMHLLLKVVW